MVVLIDLLCSFFFFKQKTAYEMRISDWSSDVCSSDLALAWRLKCIRAKPIAIDPVVNNADLISPGKPSYRTAHVIRNRSDSIRLPDRISLSAPDEKLEIGRASGRERVCQYV